MDNLITPEEAVALARYCCLDDAIFAVSVADEYAHSNKSMAGERERALFEVVKPCYIGYALSAVFNAGRIQGIREERARRKKQPQPQPQRVIKYVLNLDI